MSETVIDLHHATPPRSKVPSPIQAAAFVFTRRMMLHTLAKRYGPIFQLRLPVFGNTVVVADQAMAKQVFTASTDDLVNVQPNLSRVLGPGSVFALEGGEHRKRRKLLTPPFHGKSIRNYEKIVEEETLREIAGWPEGEEIETLEPMMRVTLNIILRAVFGADGGEFDRLRELVPPLVELGSKMAAIPVPPARLRRFTPWHRLDRLNKQFDDVVFTLMDKAQADPAFEERSDILALLMRSTYEDGTPMTRQDIADEMRTLVGAGHETTASTLAWAFERLSRHPKVLDELVAEVDSGGSELRQATINEVQRTRAVIAFAGRHVQASDFELGGYRIPKGYSIVVSNWLIHEDAETYPDPQRFDPHRWLGVKVNPYAWLPYGGGTRRCVGAAFANMELDVVLRTVLGHLAVEPTDAPDERWHSRGVAFTPKRGGRITVRRRVS
ncbi:cytochrome P450 [Mycobacterium sp. MYCO198283]|uniref:cytochrome P450 n=1 Tax=Mycobacterium sp. MYCO198283 TaxID=2883505 RepID=UPI001E51DF91|nr:cytochrome P450 [Mycobacterium sp. MYCO198283]MCG5434393.1 cytochrome P450 [Mycobacterium sp. MYCO198283]